MTAFNKNCPIKTTGELPHKHDVSHSNDQLQLCNCWNTSDPLPPGALHAVYAFLNVPVRLSPLQVTLPQEIPPLEIRAGKCGKLEVGSGWQASKPDTEKPKGHAMITESQGEPGYRGSQSQLCDEILKTVAPLTLSSAGEDAQVKCSCVAGQTAPETPTEFDDAMMIGALSGGPNPLEEGGRISSGAFQDSLEQGGMNVEVVEETSARAYSVFGIKPKGVLKRSGENIEDGRHDAKIRRVTFAPGQVDGICGHDGHPVRKYKYKPPAKLNVGNPYDNFGWKTVAPSRLKFTKQDAREMEELLGGPNDTYAPSVARMKRRVSLEPPLEKKRPFVTHPGRLGQKCKPAVKKDSTPKSGPYLQLSEQAVDVASAEFSATHGTQHCGSDSLQKPEGCVSEPEQANGPCPALPQSCTSASSTRSKRLGSIFD